MTDRWFIHLLFESDCPFPNSFQGRLPRWSCVTNHLVSQFTVPYIKTAQVVLIWLDRIRFAHFMLRLLVFFFVVLMNVVLNVFDICNWRHFCVTRGRYTYRWWRPWDTAFTCWDEQMYHSGRCYPQRTCITILSIQVWVKSLVFICIKTYLLGSRYIHVPQGITFNPVKTCHEFLF